MNDFNLMFEYKFITSNGYGKMFSNSLIYDELKEKYNIVEVYLVDRIDEKLTHINVTKEVIENA